jgi:drug/metabolite transporter (DMT)-like permease
MKEYVLALLIMLTTTGGQIFLKKAALSEDKRSTVLLLSVGYGLFMFSVLFTYSFIKIVPLKYVTVVLSLNYLAVLFASKYFLDESLTKKKIIGTVLIAAGIAVFVYK